MSACPPTLLIPKILQQRASQPFCSLHGANDFWGKNEDWALEWMDILSREGWCVLVADFYGFGERKKAGQMPSWAYGPYTGRDMVIQSVTDQRRGIDFLFSRPEVDTTKVALMGGSMGGYFTGSTNTLINHVIFGE